MSQVETVLNMLKPLIAEMSADEKSQLLQELKKLLDDHSDASANTAGQNQSNTVSNVNFDGGGNNAMNFSPVQSSGGNVEVSPNFEQTTSSNNETEQLLQALQELKQSINDDPNLDTLTKNGAQQQAENLEQEVQKSQPDSSFVQQTVTSLQEGLQGIQTLAEPTKKVAQLVGKLVGIAL